METFRLKERVIIHSLQSERGRTLNLTVGEVCALPSSETQDHKRGRIGVRPRVGSGSSVALKPANLLHADKPEDRRRALLMLVLARHPLMRIARRGLDSLLLENEGLLLAVTEFVDLPAEFVHQFSGYAHGRVWNEFHYWDSAARVVAIPSPTSDRRPSNKPTPDPSPRIDCGAVVCGYGEVLFAGGCGAHPNEAVNRGGFFKSAVKYDSLTNEWVSMPSMLTRRHGSAAVCIGREVFVLGGMYVDDPPDHGGPPDVSVSNSLCEKFAERLNLDTETWERLPAAAYQHLDDDSKSCLGMAAFFPAVSILR